MDAKKGDVRLTTSSRVVAKILLLAVLYLAALCVPLLAKETVLKGFSLFDPNTPYEVTDVPYTVFNTLFNTFVMFIGGLFIVNLFFRLIDEKLNDTVKWRRGFQIFLNVLIILVGALYLLYLTYVQIPTNGWWEFSGLNTGESPGSVLLWGGALVYSVCATLLSILDLCVFTAESRSPRYRRNKCKKQDAN